MPLCVFLYKKVEKGMLKSRMAIQAWYKKGLKPCYNAIVERCSYHYEDIAREGGFDAGQQLGLKITIMTRVSFIETSDWT